MNPSFLRAVLPAALLALGGLSALPGCDVVDNPQPPKVTVSAGRRDTLALDSAEAARPAPAAAQRVLLEDFTGQYCGNCPAAGRLIANTLRPQYGERLVTLEVHVVDFFAAPKTFAPYLVDYRAPGLSQELENAFGLNALPKGAVNRVSRGGSVALEFADWNAVVAQQLAQAPQQQLRVTPLYDAATRRLRLKVSTRYLAAQPGRTFRLGVYVSEDSLVGGQKDYSLPQGQQDVANYVHRHVLRTALLGAFGTPQAVSPAANQTATSYLTYQLPAAWQARHCAAIAFLADDATKQIVQVSEASVKD